MKVIFWGTPEYAVPSLEKIYNRYNTEILAVITQPDKRRNRGKKYSPSPVRRKAEEYGLKIYTPENIKSDTELINELKVLNADIHIVIAFGQILPIEVLSLPRYGCWNAHASLLPSWRGAAPIERTIINNESCSGVGIMLMEKGLDTGKLLLEEKISIGIYDNASFIRNKLSILSSELLLKTLEITQDLIDKNYEIDSLDLIDQSSLTDRKLSYAKMICKEECRIIWDSSSLSIHKIVMGLHPNAYTMYKDKRVKIQSTVPLKLVEALQDTDIASLSSIRDHSVHNVGTVIGISKDKGLMVLTSDGLLLISTGQLEGKKSVNSNILEQQLKLKIGDNFY